jgi:plasmid stabilization system protein ParE
MAHVIVAPSAREDLRELISILDLPPSTRSRVRERIRSLADFPMSGSRLEGRWKRFRFILGPWKWMLIVYQFDRKIDQVNVVTIQDARSAAAATSSY